MSTKFFYDTEMINSPDEICFSLIVWNSNKKNSALTTKELWVLAGVEELKALGLLLFNESQVWKEESYFVYNPEDDLIKSPNDLVTNPKLVNSLFNSVWSDFMIENIAQIFGWCKRGERYSVISFNRTEKRTDENYLVFNSIKNI